MAFPVRCFTCNKVIGQYELKFEKMLKDNVPMDEILKTFNMKRWCCRRMFLGYVNITDQLLLYSETNVESYGKKIKSDD